MDLEEMADDFVTFFVAGQETTANTLGFCFLELGKNPEIVKKAREEIDRVLGERTEVTYQLLGYIQRGLTVVPTCNDSSTCDQRENGHK